MTEKINKQIKINLIRASNYENKNKNEEMKNTIKMRSKMIILYLLLNTVHSMSRPIPSCPVSTVQYSTVYNTHCTVCTYLVYADEFVPPEVIMIFHHQP
jgi:hypothetical protein